MIMVIDDADFGLKTHVVVIYNSKTCAHNDIRYNIICIGIDLSMYSDHGQDSQSYHLCNDRI